MDNELFELCKEVYKLFEWDKLEGELTWFDQSGVEISPYDSLSKGRTETCPLYTSDYLLEKLPAYINEDGRKWFFTMCREISGKDWQVAYETIYEERLNECIYTQVSDSPLKALLMLVAVLKEAGELKI